MLGWLKNTISRVTSIFSSGQTPEFSVANLKINFHTNQLIPNTIKTQDYPSWVGSYIKELPNTTGVLIWAHQNQLQFSCTQNGQIKHLPLPDFSLNADTQCIQRDGKNVSLKNIVDALHHELPNKNLRLVDADTLVDLKFKVQFAQKFISEELLAHIKRDTQRSLQNLESSNQCSICMDDYTHENPPYLVEDTASVYHFDCLDETRRSRGTQRLNDPKSNKILGYQANMLDLRQIMKKDLAYLSAIEDVKALAKRTEQMAKALDILVQENKDLKAKVAAIPVPVAPVIAIAPVAAPLLQQVRQLVPSPENKAASKTTPARNKR